MELTFKLDTDDLYDREMSFEGLVSEQLQKVIIAKCKKNLASDKFKEFTNLASDKLTIEIKLRLENFLSEDVALNDSWGKPTFVGSLEDLIKKRFDDLLLHPVDSAGKRLQGCTSSSLTWLEWSIDKRLKDDVKQILDREKRTTVAKIETSIAKELAKLQGDSIKTKVAETFAAILKKQ
jgi:hypothetical protein